MASPVKKFIGDKCFAVIWVIATVTGFSIVAIAFVFFFTVCKALGGCGGQ